MSSPSPSVARPRSTAPQNPPRPHDRKLSEKSTDEHASSERYLPAAHIRSVAVDDFVVLLDRRSSTYLSLNDSGAAIWQGITRGLPVEDIASELACRHDHPLADLEADVRRMLGDLLAAELIAAASGSKNTGSLGEGSPWEHGDEKAPHHGAATAAWIERWQGVSPEKRRREKRILSLPRALAKIAAVEWAMRTGGMPKLRAILARHPLRTPTVEPIRAWGIVEHAQHATALYVKKAWCLQRSTACAALLRAEGVPAEVVIGVIPVPFAAHAWVEIGPHVVNDHPHRTGQFSEIDRF